MLYLIIKWLHVLLAMALFGALTLLGYMVFSRTIPVSSERRLLCFAFLPLMLMQNASGLYLSHVAGFPMSELWVLASLIGWTLSCALAILLACQPDRVFRQWHRASAIALVIMDIAIVTLMVTKPEWP